MDNPLPILLLIVFIGLGIAAAVYSYKQAAARREALANLARELGFAFDPSDDRDHDEEYAHFEIFRQGHSRCAFNTLRGAIDPAGDEGMPPLACTMGDFQYKVTRHTGKTTTTQTYRFSYLILQLPFAGVPNLLIRPEHFFDKIAGALGFDDIDFESEEFSRRFHVKSSDKKFAYDVCHPRMMAFLLSNGGAPAAIDIEFGRCCLSDGRRRWEPQQFKAMLAWANRFFEQWPEHVINRLE